MSGADELARRFRARDFAGALELFAPTVRIEEARANCPLD